MKKKLVVWLLFGSMAAASLTACGKGEEAKGNVNTVKAADGTSDEASAETGQVNFYGFDEPVNLKIGLAYPSDFKPEDGDDSEHNPWMDLYRENNIIPEILYDVDGAQGETKLSTAIMSGNYPDILDVATKDYVNYAATGVIADITEVYEKYASDELKEYLNSDDGRAMNGLMIDGKLYGLPALGSGMDSATVMFIRQDWLDRLGLEIPKTMDELKEVAHAFTYDDPDGNGKNDTYGLAVDGVNVLYDSVGDLTGVFEGFGAYPGTDAMTFIEVDGKTDWGGAKKEEMKKALAMLQEMYQDGSITKDFITMDSNSIFEEAGAGRCGIWFAPMWGAMDPAVNAAKNDPKAHIVSAAIPDGTGTGDNKTFIPNSIERAYCVSSQCENPEVLIKVMNLGVQKLCYPKDQEEFYKYYGTNYSVWKYSLTHTLSPLKNFNNYKLESEALASGDTSKLNAEQLSDYNNMRAYLDAKDTAEYDPNDPVMEAGIGLYTVFGDPQGSYAALDKLEQEDGFIASNFNGIPTETMSGTTATLKKLVIENIVKIITGESVDSYDKVLENWYALGGTEAIKEAQEWIDNNK